MRASLMVETAFQFSIHEGDTERLFHERDDEEGIASIRVSAIQGVLDEVRSDPFLSGAIYDVGIGDDVRTIAEIIGECDECFLFRDDRYSSQGVLIRRSGRRDCVFAHIESPSLGDVRVRALYYGEIVMGDGFESFEPWLMFRWDTSSVQVQYYDDGYPGELVVQEVGRVVEIPDEGSLVTGRPLASGPAEVVGRKLESKAQASIPTGEEAIADVLGEIAAVVEVLTNDESMHTELFLPLEEPPGARQFRGILVEHPEMGCVFIEYDHERRKFVSVKYQRDGRVFRSDLEMEIGG